MMLTVIIDGETIHYSPHVTMGFEFLEHKMTCSLCAKTALTVVGTKGFCGDHKGQAETATKALGSKATGSGRMVFGTPKEAVR